MSFCFCAVSISDNKTKQWSVTLTCGWFLGENNLSVDPVFCLVKGLATWGYTCASSSQSYWFMFNIRVIPSIAGTYHVISVQCGPAVLVCLYQRLGCLWWLVFQLVSEVLFTSPPCAFVAHLSVYMNLVFHIFIVCEHTVRGIMLSVLLVMYSRLHPCAFVWYFKNFVQLKLCYFTISNRAIRNIVLGLWYFGDQKHIDF